jgi:hypothetical protein
VLNEGQAIAVAKNVKVRANEMNTQARSIISIGPDNANFQVPSGLVGANPFDVNNNYYDIVSPSFVSNYSVNRRRRDDAELRSAARSSWSGREFI